MSTTTERKTRQKTTSPPTASPAGRKPPTGRKPLSEDGKRLQDDISTIVRMLVARSNCQQAELAGVLDIAASGVSDKLHHRDGRRWNVEDLDKMAKFFGVPVSLFFQPPDSLLTIPNFFPPISHALAS